MDKITKSLKKFSSKEKNELKIILSKIKQNKLDGFQIKKLKGHDNIFRVRKGKIRIIFSKRNNSFFILAIERRSDNTYNI